MTPSHLILWLTAMLWGTAFVAQSEGTQLLGAYSFNAARFICALIALFPLLFIFPSKQEYPLKTLVLGGLLSGFLLFVAFSFQQSGLNYVSAGDAGFITSIYIVFVPLFGILLGHKTNLKTWLGISFALIGFYYLAVGPNFNVNYGNILELSGALFWAFHVLTIAYFSSKLPAIPLALMQFLIAALLSSLAAFYFEKPTLVHFQQEWLPILYTGIIASGLARTLQIIAQKKVSASICALILSTEALFAVIADWLFFGVTLTANAYIGSGLILVGLLISQWPAPQTFPKRQKIFRKDT